MQSFCQKKTLIFVGYLFSFLAACNLGFSLNFEYNLHWFIDKNRLIVQWQLFLLINDCILGKLKYYYSYWLLALRNSSYQKKNESRRRSSLKPLSAPLNVFYYWRLYAGLIRLGQRDLHFSQWGLIFSKFFQHVSKSQYLFPIWILTVVID